MRRGEKMKIERLVQEIHKKGIKKAKIAERMGITRNALYMKLKRGNFTIDEAESLSNILNLSKEEKIDIFLPE